MLENSSKISIKASKEPCEGILSPSHIGPYIIESLIENNAYHECYRGFDLVKKNSVFIKRLTLQAQLSQNSVKDLFSRQIRILRTLNHPNLCSMIQSGMENGRSYLVCPYIPGITLRDFLLQGQITPSEALFIIRQIVSGISYLHNKQIIHNDLKPENIIISPTLQTTLIDFSISEKLGAHQDIKVNQLAGTLLYMSPERQTQHDINSITSDLYSLAIICYELIIGHLCHGMIHLANLPVPFQSIFSKALQNDPKLRYQSCDDFLLEIEKHKESLKGIHLPLRTSKTAPNLVDPLNTSSSKEKSNIIFIPTSTFEEESELFTPVFKTDNSCICFIKLPFSHRPWLYYLKGQLESLSQSKTSSQDIMKWLDGFKKENKIEESLLQAAWITQKDSSYEFWLHGHMLALHLTDKNLNESPSFFESKGSWTYGTFSKNEKSSEIVLILPKNGISNDIIFRETSRLFQLCQNDLYSFCHLTSQKFADLIKKTSPFCSANYITVSTLGLGSCNLSS